MKKRLVSVLAFALAVSAGAAFVLYQLIASRVKVGAAAPRPVTTKVLVASRDLEIGALIQDRDLVEQEYLNPPAGSVPKREDIVGRGVANPIHQDSPFYESSLTPKGSGAGFASIIPKGMRAFAVHVNEVVGVAGFAVAGMRVDILVSGTPPSGNANTGPVTRTLLQNIQVLSAGQNYRKDAEGKPVMVQVVNVLVTPQQAEILNLATEQSIQLVLRNPADQEITTTSGAATASLFSDVHPAPLVAAAAPTHVVRPKVVEPPPLVESHSVALPQTVNIEVFHGAQKTESSVRTDQGGAQ